MTDRAPGTTVGSTETEELAQEFMRHRPRLVAIAYRMLGSAWDAEDVVADAMVRWLGVDRSQVREPVAFLTTVVTRLALDQLRSARATRERYVGPWLPEPVLTAATAPSPLARSTPPSGPLDTLERREAASLATLRMMEALTPPERAVLVLHDAFDVPYAEIADILGITVDGARQHLHRARTRLRSTEIGDDAAARAGAADHADDGEVVTRGGERGHGKRFEPEPDAHEALFERFLDALDGGDLGRLRDLLAADAVAYSDGGGKVRAALHPLLGAGRVARFYSGLGHRMPVGDAQRIEVNGRPGALLRIGEQRVVLSVEVRDGQIHEVHSVLNPDKLRYLQRQLGDDGTR